MSYLVIDLASSGSNMLQSLGLLTAAPVLPAVLLAHALDKRLQGRRSEPALDVRGVGLIHRHAEPWIEYLDDGGYAKPFAAQRRGGCLFDREDIVKNGGPQSNAAQPMALADLEWTLLLDCAKPVPDSMAGQAADLLRRMRLAGGDVRAATVAVHDEWEKALSHALRTGHWIDDVTQDIQSASDPMLSILQAVRDPQAGWVAPVNLGYALLETPHPARDGARDALPHAFVEPMIGAIRFVPASIARQRKLTPSHLWRHGWDGDQFLVTNRPPVESSPSLKGSTP